MNVGLILNQKTLKAKYSPITFCAASKNSMNLLSGEKYQQNEVVATAYISLGHISGIARAPLGPNQG
jgi:hypothetical protein